MRSKRRTKFECRVILTMTFILFSVFLFTLSTVNACTYPDDCGQIGGCTGGKWCACCVEGEAMCYGPCDHGICCDGPNPTCCPESGCLDTENPTCDILRVFEGYELVYSNGFDSQADLDEWTIESGRPIVSSNADVGSDVYCPFYGAKLLRGDDGGDYRYSYEIKKIIGGLTEGETYNVLVMAHPGCQHTFAGCEARGRVRLMVTTPEGFNQHHETNEGEYWQEFMISFTAGSSGQTTIYLKSDKHPRCWGKWGVTGAFDELMVYKVGTEVTGACPADPNVGVSVTASDDCGGSGNCDVLNMDVRFSNDGGATWSGWVRHRAAILPWMMDLSTDSIWAQVKDGEDNIDSCLFQCGGTTTTTTTTSSTTTTTTIPTIPIPDYDFEFWIESSRLFTIGKPQQVNLYVRNTGSEKDTYSIMVDSRKAERAGYPGEDFTHLISIPLEARMIGPLSTNDIGDTFFTINVLGPITSGNITFRSIPVSNITKWKLAEIEIMSEYSGSLPEFNLIATIELMVLASFVYVLKRNT